MLSHHFLISNFATGRFDFCFFVDDVLFVSRSFYNSLSLIFLNYTVASGCEGLYCYLLFNIDIILNT